MRYVYPKGLSDLDRFHISYEVSETGCWHWIRARQKHCLPYGQFYVLTESGRRAVVGPHRWIYAHLHGPIPPGMLVCHRCDVPYCVNPDHLFLGTHLDNHRDRATKGRSNPVRGEKNTNARLTEAAVADIVRRYIAGETQKTLACEYGVGQQSISRAVTGARWKHLSRPAFDVVARSKKSGRGRKHVSESP